MAGARGRWTKGILLTAKIALSAGLLTWALSRVHLEHFWGRIHALDPFWLVLAGLAFVASNCLGAWLWGRLLRLSGTPLPFRQVLSFYFVGLFFSNLLPANVGGDVMRVYDVSRTTGSRRSAVGATVLDRLIGFLAISLLGIAALPQLPGRGPGPILLGVVGMFFLGTLLLSLAVFHRGILGALERPLGRVRMFDFGRRLTALADELYSYRRHAGTLLLLCGLAVVIQVLRISVHILVARGMGIRLPPACFFAIVPVLAMVVALPISIAGLGVRESSAVGLFGLFGLPPADAVAQQLTTFLLSLAINLTGGVIFVMRTVRRPALNEAGEPT